MHFNHSIVGNMFNSKRKERIKRSGKKHTQYVVTQSNDQFIFIVATIQTHTHIEGEGERESLYRIICLSMVCSEVSMLFLFIFYFCVYMRSAYILFCRSIQISVLFWGTNNGAKFEISFVWSLFTAYILQPNGFEKK